MTTAPRANFTHMVVGLCIMLLGILLVLDRAGIVEARDILQYWPAALILFGAALILQALVGGPDGAGSGRFPVGAVILLVLLGLFVTRSTGSSEVPARADGGVRLFAVMSGDRRVSADTVFRGGEMTSIMGGTVLDLRRAVLAPGEEAVIDVFALMGGAQVFVPAHWIVDFQTTSVMGGVRDRRGLSSEDLRRERERERRRPRLPGAGETSPFPGQPALPELPELEPSAPVEPQTGTPAPAGPAPRLVLRGMVMMGGIEIRS